MEKWLVLGVGIVGGLLLVVTGLFLWDLIMEASLRLDEVLRAQ
jgi:hypothetical protein